MLLGILFSTIPAAVAQKIYINPGHGAYTSEDRNVRTINYALGDKNGFWESKMNCTKGNYLYDFLVGNGFAAQRSRTTTGAGLDAALSTIASWANNYGANVFISIHSNAANQSANYGLICFNGTTSAPKYPASKTFGNAVWDKMLTNNLSNYTAYSLTSRNVCGDVTRLGFNLGVLKPLTRPGILTEATFHDYRPETHRFLSNAYCRMESWNLYRGICAYFGKGIPNGTTNGKGGAVVGWVRENVGFSHAQYFNARGDDTKLPLNGVKAELLNSSGGVVATYTTDGQYNGIFGFFGLNAGTYYVRLTKSGYNCVKTGAFTVNAGGCAYRKEWMSKGSNNNCGSAAPFLSLSLSTSTTTKNTLSNTQPTGKTVYLWMTDQTGAQANNGNSTLTSSNTNIATIDGYGKIVTKSAGTTTIKAVRNGGINNQGVKDGATGTLTLTVTGTPTLTLSLSSSSTSNVPISNTQAPGKTIYLWMVDNTGGVANCGNSTLTSSNTNIATIDGYGKIVTKSAGSTTIKAVRNGGVNNQGLKDGATGTLALTVTGTPTLTLSLSSSFTTNIPVSTTQGVGQTIYLWMIDNTGGKATNGNSTLTSSNTTVATIDGEGKIVTKAGGTTTIKAVRDGGIYNSGNKDNATGTLTLTVSGTPFLILSLSSVSNDAVSTPTTQAPNKTIYLRMYDSLGNFASNGNSTLSSSNTAVATIDGEGKIVTKAAGTTTINAVRDGGIYGQGLKDGAKGSLTLTVTNGTIGLTLVVSSAVDDYNKAITSIAAGKTAYLFVQDNASKLWVSRPSCVLTSSNKNVADVSAYGTITTKAAGDVTFTATYNGVSGTVSFKVTAAAAAPTDISTPVTDEIKIISTDAGVVVKFDGEALVELYTANGVLVDKAQATGGYERDLDKGVYILRVNGQTKKFVK